MAYMEAKEIYKTFGKGDAAVHALRGASLSADKGEMVAVMGKSGSGKSTLLNILGGLMTRAYPSELSGGQQQRAAIARALVKDAAVILADEPTGALDEETGREVMELLRELKMKDRVIIIVTHDEKVAEYCDRIVYLRDGVQVEKE